MARVLGFLCAALLLASAQARAAGSCDATEQRPGAQSRRTHNDKRQSDQASAGPRKWWIDGKLRSELGITDRQSAAIEQVWQHSLAQRAARRDLLDKRDAILQKMILEAVDEATLTAQFDKVEAVRSEVNKARVLVLYRINKLLTHAQRAKLDAKAKAMRERDRRHGGGRGR